MPVLVNYVAGMYLEQTQHQTAPSDSRAECSCFSDLALGGLKSASGGSGIVVHASSGDRQTAGDPVMQVISQK